MKKLKLQKSVISSLTEREKQIVVGGEAITTSFTNCTHFVCCGDTCATLPPIKSITPPISCFCTSSPCQ